MEIFRVNDNKENLRFTKKQKVSAAWIRKNLDKEDIEKLSKGGQIGVTMRKGRGYCHFTLIGKP